MYILTGIECSRQLAITVNDKLAELVDCEATEDTEDMLSQAPRSTIVRVIRKFHSLISSNAFARASGFFNPKILSVDIPAKFLSAFSHSNSFTILS